uniref:tRNA pseudouridine(55) synthase n=1 Tax=Arcella intermedia TaxID=1963864 RepID=A0A6B2LGH2_9EUKA
MDPMAHGVLILLVGEENKKRKEYEFCTKDYTWEMVLGWQTDTYDILGMVSSPVECAACKWSNDDELTQQVNQIVSKQIGKQVQKYPPYSSVRVNGKLLFQWAKENKLDSIEIPSKTIEIFSLSLKSITKIPLSSFISQTHSRIDGISPQNNGKFREPEIKRKWDQVLLANDPNMDLTVLTFNAFVSHGAYVRSIAQDIGLQLGTGAVVVDLLRTRVGEHLLDQSLRV